jgi:cyclase
MKPFRKKLRENMTEAETILWSLIRKKQIGFQFRRQVSIGHYVVDFYCKDLNLAIEIDGGIHSNKDQKEYDSFRQEIIESVGINFLRFKNEEVVHNLTKVIKEIKKTCRQLNQVSPPAKR